ncbi:hypothetical protein X777_10089, partial [Ooceraea biroi]
DDYYVSSSCTFLIGYAAISNEADRRTLITVPLRSLPAVRPHVCDATESRVSSVIPNIRKFSLNEITKKQISEFV